MDASGFVRITESRARVAVLGDVHLGPRVGRDAFGHEAEVFLSWLRELLEFHDHLVLNGDIFQLDHELGLSEAAQERALLACLHRLPELEALLASPRVHLVAGNHDRLTRRLLGAAAGVLIDSGQGRLLATHGDACDPVIGGAPAVSQAATWVTGRMRAVGVPRLAGWLEQRDVDLKAARFRGPQGPYARGAAGLMVEERADVVVFGHTHATCRH